jgi:hypothetical protein
VYAWIWRHLPGPVFAKLLLSLALVAAIVLSLFMWVFPWIEPQLPFNDVTVDESGTVDSSPGDSGTVDLGG